MKEIEVNKQGLSGLIGICEAQDGLLLDMTGLMADLEAEACGPTAARLRRAIGVVHSARRQYRDARKLVPAS